MRRVWRPAQAKANRAVLAQGAAASDCGIAAGRDISGSRIEQHCHFYSQDPKALAEAARIFAGQLNASVEAKAQAEAHAAELARQLGTPAEAAEQFLRL